MRLIDWLRGSRLSDDLDPTLTTLFAHRDAHDEVTPAQFARMRAEVDVRLHHDVPSGRLVRRLGLAALGGGSMWTGLIGMAAAHKAAAVTVGIGMVFGGSVAAEASGVGPAVRSAVTSTVQGEPGGPNVDLFTQTEVEATATASVTATASATATAEQTAEAEVQAGAGHETCYAATAHARAVLSALADGSHFADLELPAQAQAELGPRDAAQVAEALAAIENCGTGDDADEGQGQGQGQGRSSDVPQGPPADLQQGPPTDLQQGPPADLPQGPPADLSQAGAGTGAASVGSEAGVDVHDSDVYCDKVPTSVKATLMANGYCLPE